MTFLMEPDSTNFREMFQPSTGELFLSSQISEEEKKTVWQVLCWLFELRSLGDGMLTSNFHVSIVYHLESRWRNPQKVA